jgi:hypothetical protein
MVHEIAFPFAWRPTTHAALGVATIVMARLVIGAADRVFLSIPGWEPQIRRLCPWARSMEWLPIPSNVGANAHPDEVEKVRHRYCLDSVGTMVGHFGTFGVPITNVLAPAASELLARRQDTLLLLMGRNSDRFRTQLLSANPALAGRVHATGELAAERLSAHLRACDALLQPYPDGVSSRRTSMMAGLANAVPVVTNLGVLSEPLWAETPSVIVSESPAPLHLATATGAVLDLSHTARAELGCRGAELYTELFSAERVIATLLGNR